MSKSGRYRSFGKQIKELRQSKAKLVRKVAADLDIDQSVLSKLENGLLFPNATLIEKIAKYYHVSLDELKTLLYADKIMSQYATYPHADKVINLVRERLAEYHTESNHQHKEE